MEADDGSPGDWGGDFEFHYRTQDRANTRKVLGLYRILLQRPPDPVGLQNYTQAMRAGIPFQDLIEAFLDGAEYRASTPAMDSVRRGEIIDSILAELTVCDDDPLLAELGGWPMRPDGGCYRCWLDDYEGRRKSPVSQDHDVAPVNGETFFTIVLHIGTGTGEHARRAIDSLAALPADNWEAALMLPPRLALSSRNLLEEAAKRDPRIKLGSRRSIGRLLKKSGMRSPDGRPGFLLIANAPGVFSKMALSEIGGLLLAKPKTEAILFDEDGIDAAGNRHAPRFGAAWDPESALRGRGASAFALKHDVTLHAMAPSLTYLLRQGFSPELFLAALKGAARIVHTPAILFHRFTPPQTPALAASIIGRMQGRRLLRRLVGNQARIVQAPGQRDFHAIWALPRNEPTVSVIVPTRDRADLLRTSVRGLLDKTDYRNLEVIIVDNDSWEPSTKILFRELSADRRVTIRQLNGEFNWGAANNLGVANAGGEVVLLLNNDVEVVHPGWLRELVAQCLRPDIGIVGAMLLYPDGKLQHGGMTLLADGRACHVMRFADPTSRDYNGALLSVRTVSAVTGACMALRKSTFETVGGIDERELKVTCSDVDLCLKVEAAGWRNLWTPFARLIHRELATRGGDLSEEKAARALSEQHVLASRWRRRLQSEPYWSGSLALVEGAPELAVPPRWSEARRPGAARFGAPFADARLAPLE